MRHTEASFWRSATECTHISHRIFLMVRDQQQSVLCVHHCLYPAHVQHQLHRQHRQRAEARQAMLPTLLQLSLHRRSASAYLQTKRCRGQRHAAAELHAAKALPSGGWGVQRHPVFVGVLVWSQPKHANSPTCIANQPIQRLTTASKRLTGSCPGCKYTT